MSKAVTGQSDCDEIKGMIQPLGTRMDSFESKQPQQQSCRPTQQPQQESLTQQEAQSWTPQPRYQSRKPTQPQQR